MRRTAILLGSTALFAVTVVSVWRSCCAPPPPESTACGSDILSVPSSIPAPSPFLSAPGALTAAPIADSGDRNDNPTDPGDFAPGFAGHRRPLDLDGPTSSTKLLPLDLLLRNERVGTDETSHAAAVMARDLYSNGRGGLDFELRRTYSSLSQYRRTSLEKLAAYLNPYFEYQRDVTADEHYFDLAFNSLFATFLTQARAEQAAWWDWWGITVDGGALGTCAEPVGCSGNYVSEQLLGISAPILGCYLAINPSGVPSLVECMVDQFGETMMPHRNIGGLLARMDAVIHYMEESGYNAVLCYDATTLETVSTTVPSSGIECNLPLVVAKLQLEKAQGDLQAEGDELRGYFATMADATAEFDIPDWWGGRISPGWSFDLPFVELPGPDLGAEFDLPGAVHFDGYRRRVLDRQTYREFPEEGALYWNLSDARSYLLMGSGPWQSCDFIGYHRDERNPSPPQCSPVPGLGFSGTVRIGPQTRFGLEHLVMIKDRLYWFDQHGRLAFITNHKLNNYIEISWGVFTEGDPNSSHITQIRDAAGNLYDLRYTTGPNRFLKSIHAQTQGKVLLYQYGHDGESDQWSLSRVHTLAVDPVEGDDGSWAPDCAVSGSYLSPACGSAPIHLKSWYEYESSRVLECLPAPSNFFDCDELNGVQPFLESVVNPLGGVVHFEYHPWTPSEMTPQRLPWPFPDLQESWFVAYLARPLPTVRREVRADFVHRYDPDDSHAPDPNVQVAWHRIERLYPKSTWVEEEGGGKRRLFTTIDRDLVTEHVIATRSERDVLERTRLCALKPTADEGARWLNLSDDPSGYPDQLAERLRETVRRYTAFGHPLEIWHKKGHDASDWLTTRFEYLESTPRANNYGLPDTMTVSDSVQVFKRLTYDYHDKFEWLVTEVGGSAVPTTTSWNETHLKPYERTSTEPASGQTTAVRYLYDMYGNLEHVWGPAGSDTGIEYAAVGSLPSVYPHKLTRSGNLTVLEEHFAYDGVGRLENFIDARGFSHDFTYDGVGRLRRIQGPRDAYEYTYVLGYDSLAQLPTTEVRHEERPLGGSFGTAELTDEVVSTGFNRLSRWHTHRGAENAIYAFSYDNRGRLKQRKRGVYSELELQWDPLDREVYRKDARMGTWFSRYDDNYISRAGELSCSWGDYGSHPLTKRTVRNPQQEVTTYYSDGQGQLRVSEENHEIMPGPTWKDPWKLSPVCWRYGWDERNRLRWERSPVDIATVYGYDGLDRRTSRDIFEVSPQTDPPLVPPTCEAADESCSRQTFTFYDDGQLESRTDGNGHTTTLAYDDFGRQNLIDDPVGRTRETQYDEVGNVVLQKWGVRARAYTYDSRGHPRTFLDGEQNLSVYDYTHLGELRSVTVGLDGGIHGPGNLPDPLPPELTQTWVHGLDGPLSHADQDGYVYTWTYSPLGGLDIATEPRGPIATKDWHSNALGDIYHVTDAYGKTTIFRRDGLGRLAGISIDWAGEQSAIRYNSFGQVKSYTEFPDRPSEATWYYFYDAEGRLSSIRGPTGNEQHFNYDSHGRLIGEHVGTSVEPRETWTYRYDKEGNLRFAENPLGSQLEIRYDGANRPVYVQPPHQDGRSIVYEMATATTRAKIRWADALGNESVHEFDGNGHLVRTLDPSGYERLLSYDRRRWLDGYVYRHVDSTPDSYEENYGYWPTGWMKSLTFGDGSQILYDYDESGNMTRITDAAGLETFLRYEGTHEKPTIIRSPVGGVRLTYGPALRIWQLAISGPGVPARVTGFFHDDDRREAHEWAAGWNVPGSGAGKTTYRYDAEGNLIETERPSGSKVRYDAYDEKGRLLAMTSATGTEFTYAYNELGQLESRTVDGQPNGPELTYRSDGMLEFLKDGGGTWHHSYDLAGRLERTAVNGAPHVTYGYYPNGWLQTATFESGLEKSFTYDGKGLVATVMESDPASAGSKEIRFGYDGLGRTTRETVDGTVHQASYYPNGTLASLEDVTYVRSSTTGLVERIERPGYPNVYLDNDGLGQLQRKWTDAGFEENYRYYNSGKLRRIWNASSQILLAYDADGRPATRTSITSAGSDEEAYGYDGDDRLKHATSQIFGELKYDYDGASNLTKVTEDTQEETRSFDQYNRLTRIVRGAQTTAVHYDSRNNVVQLQEPTTTTDFSVDDLDRVSGVKVDGVSTVSLKYDSIDRLVSDTDHTDGTTRILAHFGTLALAIGAVSLAPDPASGQAIALFDQGALRHPTWILNSTALLSADDGSELHRVVRKPYGALALAPGTPGEHFPLGFKGYYEHQGAERHWAYTRTYDAGLRHFTAPDSLLGAVERPKSMNRYRAFSGNPVSVVDVLGFADDHFVFEGVCIANCDTPKKRRTYEPRGIPPRGPPSLTGRDEKLRWLQENLEKVRENTQRRLKEGRFRREARREYFESEEAARRALANANRRIEQIEAEQKGRSGVGSLLNPLGVVEDIFLEWQLGEATIDRLHALHDLEDNPDDQAFLRIGGQGVAVEFIGRRIADIAIGALTSGTYKGQFVKDPKNVAKMILERPTSVLRGAMPNRAANAAERVMAKKGIYEFIDKSGKKYVGQSGDIPRRIKEHIRSGRLPEANRATIVTWEVKGGKTVREVAEQTRIDQLGGINRLGNRVNPIGKRRRQLLDEYADLMKEIFE